jgi:molybdopterin molybdotransferase
MKTFISFSEALNTTLSHVCETSAEFIPLIDLQGRILAADLISKVDSPSLDASLKDGFAVRSSELSKAGPETPVTLELAGHISAGRVVHDAILEPGKAFRITTGSAIPQGADSVLAEEFTQTDGKSIICQNTAEKGRNVLTKGTDIEKGERIAKRGDKITPALTGLIATAGFDGARVFRQPRVCVIATGDEIVAPGLPLPEGKLYASNVTEICAWLAHFGMQFDIAFVKDTRDEIRSAILAHKDSADAFMTSGGVWGSEKDLMIHVLDQLEWQGLYHRVRMGPGKAIAFGLLSGKPFFCLPGGPPSNEMAFLQIALPAVLRMTGDVRHPFPMIPATLTQDAKGRESWTQFVHAHVDAVGNGWAVTPMKQESRLQSMANKNALIILPEGCGRLDTGKTVMVQLLDTRAL